MYQFSINAFTGSVVALSLLFVVYFAYRTSFNDAIMHDHPIAGWFARILLAGIVLISWAHVMGLEV